MKQKTVPTIVNIIFVSTLISSNIVATKLVNFFGFTLPASIIIFPITYIIGDVVTEIFGYKEMRKIIFQGFLANLITALVIYIALFLPSADIWEHQIAYSTILGQSSIILLASFCGYLAGSLLNSWSMDFIKAKMRGKHLWFRIIVSTMLGEGVDTFIFITIAFSSLVRQTDLFQLILTQWVIKIMYEILITPFTSLLVRKLRNNFK